MLNLKAGVIISITIALMMVGLLLPTGLTDLVGYNGSYYYSNGTLIGTNATIGSLVGTIIPIMLVVGLMLLFVKPASQD